LAPADVFAPPFFGRTGFVPIETFEEVLLGVLGIVIPAILILLELLFAAVLLLCVFFLVELFHLSL